MKNTLIAQTTLNFANEARDAGIPGVTSGSAEGDFGNWLGTLMSAVMVIAAILVLVFLLWGGIEWITSGGDKGKTENARNKITSAVIGILVLAASTAIFMIMQNILGIEALRFGGTKNAGGSENARDRYSIEKATQDERKWFPDSFGD
jgi:hypothetical protein